MNRLRSTVSGLSQQVLNYLAPAAIEDDPLWRVQAGRTVSFGLAMLFWAPIFAPIYYFLGSSRGAVMIAGASYDVVLVEACLTSGDSCKFAQDILHESTWGGHLIMMLSCDELPLNVAKREEMGVHY